MWKQGGRIMHQMDLTEGVIWKKLILYAGPVVLSSLLQSAYSITDLIVAGWFIGKDVRFRPVCGGASVRAALPA